MQRRVTLALGQADDFQVKRAEGERQLEQLQRQQAGKVARQLGRQHGSQFTAGDDMRGLQVIGRCIANLPAQALFAQPLVDHAARLTAVYPQVAQLQKGRQVHRLVAQRMVAAQRQLQGFAHPVLAGKARGDVLETPQHQVQLALVQRFGRQAGAQVADVDAHAGCLLAELFKQPWHADQLDIVGDGDAEVLTAAGRVEHVAGTETLFQLLQGRADRRFQRLGARRGLHAAAHPHQQRVIEQFAQAIQCVADCRLAQGQAFGRAGNVLLAHQCIEHAQQVEVEGREIHLLNTTYHKTKFQK